MKCISHWEWSQNYINKSDWGNYFISTLIFFNSISQGDSDQHDKENKLILRHNFNLLWALLGK